MLAVSVARTVINKEKVKQSWASGGHKYRFTSIIIITTLLFIVIFLIIIFFTAFFKHLFIFLSLLPQLNISRLNKSTTCCKVSTGKHNSWVVAGRWMKILYKENTFNCMNGETQLERVRNGEKTKDWKVAVLMKEGEIKLRTVSSSTVHLWATWLRVYL